MTCHNFLILKIVINSSIPIWDQIIRFCRILHLYNNKSKFCHKGMHQIKYFPIEQNKQKKILMNMQIQYIITFKILIENTWRRKIKLLKSIRREKFKLKNIDHQNKKKMVNNLIQVWALMLPVQRNWIYA